MKKLAISAPLIVLALIVAAVGAVALSGSAALGKIDYLHVFTRTGWQLPQQVIESLELRPGDQVADIGAGGGYFTFRLADAVGPTGRVFAVDVDEDVLQELRDEVRERGYTNITVVRGEFDDPLLPDGEIDLVFVCNTYHHIDGQTAYFDRLRTDLEPEGRVALLEVTDDPLVKLVVPSGHWTRVEVMRQEMGSAHYRRLEGFEYLPLQSFEIFTAASDS